MTKRRKQRNYWWSACSMLLLLALLITVLLLTGQNGIAEAVQYGFFSIATWLGRFLILR
jgi:hypothetical protein